MDCGGFFIGLFIGFRGVFLQVWRLKKMHGKKLGNLLGGSSKSLGLGDKFTHSLIPPEKKGNPCKGWDPRTCFSGS